MQRDELGFATSWWGQLADERKIHWKPWTCLTSSKDEGGMGFRDFEEFNLALVTKLRGRMLQNPNVLWSRILKGVYFPNCHGLHLEMDDISSFVDWLAYGYMDLFIH